METKERIYPTHLLKYLIRLVEKEVTATIIISDEYLFGSYFATLFQALKDNNDNYDSIIDISDQLKKIVNEAGASKFKFTPTNHIADINLEKREKLFTIVAQFSKQFNDTTITSTYVTDFLLALDIYNEIVNRYKNQREAIKFVQLIVNKIKKIIDDQNKLSVSSITLNVNRISDCLSLTPTETALIEVSLLFSIDPRSAIFRDTFITLSRNTWMIMSFYITMIDDSIEKSSFVYNDKDFIDLFSERNKTIALGIVNYQPKTLQLKNISPFWCFALSNYASSDEEFFSRFIEPIPKTIRNFSGVIAKINPKDTAILEQFIKTATRSSKSKAVSDNGETSKGLNILMYGVKSLDKLKFVKDLLDRNNIQGMRVRTRDAHSHDVPGICYVAQSYITRLNKDEIFIRLLVIEKAELALTKTLSLPSWFQSIVDEDSISSDKHDTVDSDDILLSGNPTPSIWITADVTSINPDNIGQFLFHVEFTGGSRKDRREAVSTIVNELGFSETTVQTLAKYYELTTQQIQSAARTIDFIDIKGEEGEKHLIHLIGNCQKALNREKTEDIRDSVTKYDLDLLNLSGNMPIKKIISALKRNSTGTLCFYGPPGTGKTQLAEFIAMEVDKPLLIKPASELLSMWLGESEKNIAKMFDEARTEDAVLLLDEADSFLRDRSTATKSWEVTQVNELLQRMERFKGIFICATNIFSMIDAGALRRFTFKLEFLPLSAEQRLTMLINETGIDFNTLDPVIQEEIFTDLVIIPYLTPGDFATVRRQMNIFNETLSLDEWLARLRVESNAKLAGSKRNTYLSEESLNVTVRQK